MMDVHVRQFKGRVHRLGPVGRIPHGEGRVFEVAGRAVAVFRTRDGRLFATQAACPHRQGPLADGILGGDLLICPLHGFKFDLATGLPVGHDCGPLETYAVELDDREEILLRLDGP